MRVLVGFAALWLGLVGVVLLFAGAGCTLAGLGSLNEREITENPFRDLPEAVLAVGLVTLLVGGPHLAASFGIRARRAWGRWLGILVALAVLLLLVAFIPRADGPELASGRGDIGAWLAGWLVPVLGYGLTLVGLLVWYPPVRLVRAGTPPQTAAASEVDGSNRLPGPDSRERERSHGPSISETQPADEHESRGSAPDSS